VNGLATGMRLVLSLAVVLGLLALAAKAARNGGFAMGGARRSSAPVAVLHRQGLAKSASLVVVRAADRALVLGVTDHTVSLLAEVDPSAVVLDQPSSPVATNAPIEPARTPVLATPSWRTAIDAMRDRTVRKP